jgi:hypothetical protein
VFWPPNEDEWRDLLRLPPDADRVAVRQAIEAAVCEYINDAGRDEQLRAVYLQIRRAAGSRQVEKLCQAILQLKNFPLDPATEAMLRQVEALRRLHSDAELRATIYLVTSRRGRFMSRLSLAWTGPGRGICQFQKRDLSLISWWRLRRWYFPVHLMARGLSVLQAERERGAQRCGCSINFLPARAA